MRKFYYLCSSLLVLVVLGIHSCSRDFLSTELAITEEKLSVDDARKFFEGQFSQTRSVNSEAKRGIVPGDFTPNWGRAVSDSRKSLAGVDIPIQPHYRYQVLQAEFKNGRSRAYVIPIYQKLVVVKGLKTEKMASYILTLIPTIDYYRAHKTEDIASNFVNCGDRGRFSGRVLYSMQNGLTVRVNVYEDGLKLDGIFIPTASDKRSAIEKAKGLVYGMKVIRQTAIMTRSGENTQGEIDGGWIDEIVVVPDDFTDDKEDDSVNWWDDEEEFKDYTPNYDYTDPDFDGDHNETGENNEDKPDLDTPTTEQPDPNSEYKDKLKGAESEINKAFASLVKSNVELKVGEATLKGNIAEMKGGNVLDFLFNKTTVLEITMPVGLNDMQMKLVLFHEYYHVYVTDISRTAGSQAELGKTHPELLRALQTQGVNDAQHSYMGINIDQYEALLRETFPNEDPLFYSYGKWGGGANTTPEFRALPSPMRRHIVKYLIKNELY